jgi:hypothetical protein
MNHALRSIIRRLQEQQRADDATAAQYPAVREATQELADQRAEQRDRAWARVRQIVRAGRRGAFHD